MDENLQHHGVKGMRWGVRRYQPYPKGSDSRGKFVGKKTNRQGGSKKEGFVKGLTKSSSRELKALNKSRLKNLNKMNTREIQKHTNRLRLENDLKELSMDKSIGSLKDVKEYHRRGDMSDSELRRKVNRLRAKEHFKKQANRANEHNVELAKSIVKVVAPMAVGYVIAKSPKISGAISGTVGGALKDIDPKQKDKLISNAIKMALR